MGIVLNSSIDTARYHGRSRARNIPDPGMNDALQLHRDGPVARLRMTRAQVHNAFDAGLVAGLTAALDEVAADAAVRVLVLEADGASFSAGAEIGRASCREGSRRRGTAYVETK